MSPGVFASPTYPIRFPESDIFPSRHTLTSVHCPIWVRPRISLSPPPPRMSEVHRRFLFQTVRPVSGARNVLDWTVFPRYQLRVRAAWPSSPADCRPFCLCSTEPVQSGRWRWRCLLCVHFRYVSLHRVFTDWAKIGFSSPIHPHIFITPCLHRFTFTKDSDLDIVRLSSRWVRAV